MCKQQEQAMNAAHSVTTSSPVHWKLTMPINFISCAILLGFLSCLHTCTSQVQVTSSHCSERCGTVNIPFPFYLSKSCISISSAFRLSCSSSSTLLLNIGAQNYSVLDFFSDGVLVDFPGQCHQYNDLRSFGKEFRGNDYFGISVDNVIGLYDCEDSSLCKADCETLDLPGCNGSGRSYPSCCYPLSDHRIWHVQDGFSVFSKFGCRGFSSWVIRKGDKAGKRGVKLEWAIPGNSSMEACASNAEITNATAIARGIRCMCPDGFIGDGFANGTQCLKSCIKDGREAYGDDCYNKTRNNKKVAVAAGVLIGSVVAVGILALLCLLKRKVKLGEFDVRRPASSHFGKLAEPGLSVT